MTSRVRFLCNCRDTNWGENIFVVGSSDSLGNWCPELAIPLTKNGSDFPNWTSGFVSLEQGSTVKFKFLIKRSDSSVDGWEPIGGNRTLRVPFNSESIEVKANWGDGGRFRVSVDWKIDLSSLCKRQVWNLIRSFQPVTSKALRKAFDTFIRGQKDDLRLLLFVGADIDGMVKGKTALMRAVREGSLEAVELLVKAGARFDVLTKNDVGHKKNGCFRCTALHEAVFRPHPEIAKFLLARGANPNAVADKGWRPLHVASSRGFKDLVALLLAHGGNLHARAAGGFRALHFAVHSGDRSTVELLLDQETDCPDA
uniref:CBM20 domain-containing protein n=1 Tax=Chromera velia CCMP2878 TaxID=1169474 RepID=A0A0G4FK58_9ALVE|eukprot:Cvel_17302.t1-p1 / transcript=Cvel_17302.t1 / gene=Cvel_17302 / organism=Chromera_velia_CCMP2878 / gene_product=Ankyrin repeat domain-containing protein 39, putative / transcript_product=Ankyrin repeat domain-containing protein 39, putative / location=Cvel_scaffold1373:38456-39388(+) / protein_length=311 / sequence_SO=supercontig / SO=protein_coding / is_pseudo=false